LIAGCKCPIASRSFHRIFSPHPPALPSVSPGLSIAYASPNPGVRAIFSLDNQPESSVRVSFPPEGTCQVSAAFHLMSCRASHVVCARRPNPDSCPSSMGHCHFGLSSDCHSASTAHSPRPFPSTRLFLSLKCRTPPTLPAHIFSNHQHVLW